jgi:general stress protein CsbA
MKLGKRAEYKSLFYIIVIFVMAMIGAKHSTGGYRFGQEAANTITGAAVASQAHAGWIGLILAFFVLMGLLVIGYMALTKKSSSSELNKINKDIESLSKRLKQIDNSF